MKMFKARTLLVLLTFVFATMLFAACKTTTPTVNLKLAELKAGDVTLVETDGKYVHSVGYEVGSLTLSATAKDSSATVEGTGEKTLTIGKNEFTVTVSKSGKTAVYAVEITRAAAVLDLTEVKIGDNVLTAGADGAYTFNAEYTVKTVTLSATAAKSYVEIEGLGEKTLNVGENTFTITAKAGDATKNYTVKVVRAAADLTLAEVKIGNEVVTANADGVYARNVDSSVKTITLSAMAVNDYVEIEGLGEKTLNVGENTFTITAKAGDATKNYTVKITRALPTYDITFNGDVDGAVTSEDSTYKHGEAQTIEISLADKYTQSYGKITVTYKVGDGEEKTATLDGNHAFTVSAEDATGDIVISVTGIEINVYTVTYHKGGEITTEKVEHGENATKYTITPNTETKAVLDGYVYAHDEKCVTEENGMTVASFENITKDIDVYYKDEIFVIHDYACYTPNPEGSNTYRAVSQMNTYVSGDQNGDVIFKVLIKSLATDGTQEEAGKTSFVIYGTVTYNPANELGVTVLESELNKWFTVKATAADKKVTVYNPDGAVVAEKTFEAYAADVISLAMHADVKVAAVNPTVPEICTVTYLNENGEELHSERLFKGAAADDYDYSISDEDLGGGYTKQYLNGKWVDENGDDVDLSAINANITVKYAVTDTIVYINVPGYDASAGYKSVMSLNKYLQPDENGVLTFKVRLNHSEATSFSIYESTGWTTEAGYMGQWVDSADLGKTWFTVEFNSVTGVLKIYDGNGNTDDGHTKTFADKDVRTLSIVFNGVKSVDIAAVNPADRMPFGSNVGEVFLDSEIDTTVATPELYEKVMKRKSYTADTFNTIDISNFTEIRFKTLYTNNYYLFDGDWGANDFKCTEWLEWQLVKSGETWTLSIYSDSKTYKTVAGLTGSTIRDMFKNKWSGMVSGGIGQDTDYIWTTELRAK